MGYQFPPDVRETFDPCLAAGHYESEDELLRKALAALERQQDDLAALQEALADLEQGDRGVPFTEFAAEFRESRGLAADA